MASVSLGYAQGLSVGTTDITAEYGGLSGKATLTVTEPPVIPDSVLATVSYSTDGGKNADRHLNIGVTLDPVLSGATVTISISLDDAPLGEATGLTNSNGFVGWAIKNASSGTYHTQVVSLVANGNPLPVTTIDGQGNSGFTK